MKGFSHSIILCFDQQALTWALLLSSSSSFLLSLLTRAVCLLRFCCSRGRSCSSWVPFLSSWNSGQNFNSRLNTDICVETEWVYRANNKSRKHTHTQPAPLWRCMDPAPSFSPESAAPVRERCLPAGQGAWRSWWSSWWWWKSSAGWWGHRCGSDRGPAEGTWHPVERNSQWLEFTGR